MKSARCCCRRHKLARRWRSLVVISQTFLGQEPSAPTGRLPSLDPGGNMGVPSVLKVRTTGPGLARSHRGADEPSEA